MVELADIFRRAGAAYRRAFHGHIPPSHLRAIKDIVRCRTPALGGSVYACDDCGTKDYAYHSCCNRHCPKCQDDRAQTWLDRLRARLLSCDHYLLTFTLPAELRTLARSNQRLVYAILLREAAASAGISSSSAPFRGRGLPHELRHELRRPLAPAPRLGSPRPAQLRCVQSLADPRFTPFAGSPAALAALRVQRAGLPTPHANHRTPSSAT